MLDRDGVVTVQDAGGIGNSLRFRGTLTANYATEKWSVGARARHFSGYYLFYKNLATGEYPVNVNQGSNRIPGATFRSEEHTSELQSLMRISSDVFCLKKKKKKDNKLTSTTQ